MSTPSPPVHLLSHSKLCAVVLCYFRVLISHTALPCCTPAPTHRLAVPPPSQMDLPPWDQVCSSPEVQRLLSFASWSLLQAHRRLQASLARLKQPLSRSSQPLSPLLCAFPSLCVVKGLTTHTDFPPRPQTGTSAYYYTLVLRTLTDT